MRCELSHCLVLTQFPIRTQRGYLLWRHLETGSRLVHKCVHTADKTKLFCLQYIENCLRLSRTQFTARTPTRQDCLFVLSCQRCKLSSRQSQTVFNILETKQFCPVLSAVRMHLWTSLDPVSNFDVTIGNHIACKLETGSGQDETQFTPHFETGQNCFEIFSHRQSWLVAIQFTPWTPTGQDRTVLSCLVSAVWTSHKTQDSVLKMKGSDRAQICWAQEQRPKVLGGHTYHMHIVFFV